MLLIRQNGPTYPLDSLVDVDVESSSLVVDVSQATLL